MQLILLIFKLLGFINNNASKKKAFYIDDKWTIELPPNWDTTSKEIELEVGSDNLPIIETIFFQIGSYLNIKAYYLDISKDGIYKKVEADTQDVAEVFENIISKIENKKEYHIPNYRNSKMKSYEYTYYENDKNFYAITTGFFMKGRLLKIDIASTIKKDVEKSMSYLFTIKETDPKKMAFLKKVDSYRK
ncbi:hypothetical protein [Fusobacterium canifelinum]|uniref:DUF1795 domain-containing protein n=1 Tax=Fusobacterium canifelinum TaxID=285729 RepID=A0ABX7CB48_9FUSO|nr:hypothetical protein [Fusobacterium canifelinum]QQS86766.1 hypothetical protein I6I83_06850 [Fusobacterium canifelinum]